MRLFYNDHYSATSHAIDATQKPRWIADSLLARPVANVTLQSPSPVTAEQLLLVHDAAYVEAVRAGRPRRLANSSTFPWNENTWVSEINSCGGMVEACNAALLDGVAGSLSSGFHHAKRESGRAHCIFNGLALAVQQMHLTGVKRILHIDLDAHCGGGTFSLVGKLEGYHQLDVSLYPTDNYVPTGNSTLDIIESAKDYLPVIEDRLNELPNTLGTFDLCLYYAGMDPHEGSAYGGPPGIDANMLAARDELIFSRMRLQGIPVAFGLGGGYIGLGLDQEGLVGLHRTTIELAAKYSAE